MSLEVWEFGLWTLAVFLIGLWLGRKSKWEEVKDLEPRLPAIPILKQASPEEQFIQDRLTPKPLTED